ncbi:hypothetical protein NEIG_01714 [Nematocida sp. ERTm5]|nr:hypothetical protein NEIRO02_1161 [Nematocida sp. AWRm79]KAI5183469.1 hypothetical protein NEIRO03_1064 [Nematocida sp. AWRm78]OAG32397.1 hypothetical protein NEIG_01714 [Nematocida sp. ERTm5]
MSAIVSAEHPEILTKDQLIFHLNNLNVSRGVLIITSNTCQPCKALKNTLYNQYFQTPEGRSNLNKFVIITIQDSRNPSVLMGPGGLVQELNVKNAPSVFIVDVSMRACTPAYIEGYDINSINRMIKMNNI